LLSPFSHNAHAAAAVSRQQQIKSARQQAEQQAYDQAVAQYQQAQVQAYQQAVAQRQQAEAQAYQEAAAQYQVAQVQAVRQAIARRQQAEIQAYQQAQVQAYQQAQAQAYQQAAVQHQVAQYQAAQYQAAQIQQGIQVKQVEEHMAAKAIAGAAQGMALKAYQEQAVGRQADQARVLAAGRPYEPAAREEVRDIVDIAQVWSKLETNSKVWPLLIDNQAKSMTVNEFMERFRKEKIKIQKPSSFYAKMVDDMSAQDPQMLRKPFKEILQMLAIMEYDYDNGTDRDTLARKLLGDRAYLMNRKRLGK
ncbi:MAG: hypothetical protein HY591_04670, partial [Candidatus Omnitrophica bacterium]|nr:hypothetical protein [Candidatus Omnitrophota bacterium]